MATITACACPNGAYRPSLDDGTSMVITDEITPDQCGEVVSREVHKAWKAGFDPALSPFVVLVFFS